MGLVLLFGVVWVVGGLALFYRAWRIHDIDRRVEAGVAQLKAFVMERKGRWDDYREELERRNLRRRKGR